MQRKQGGRLSATGERDPAAMYRNWKDTHRRFVQDENVARGEQSAR